MNNKVRIKVVGNNVNRFVMKLNNKNINLYDVFKKNDDCCFLVIDYKSYDDVIKYKTYYDITIIDYLGPIKIKNNLKKNKYYIIIFIISFVILLTLSKLTFKINIITNDHDLKKLLNQELKVNGIYKYSWLKNYKDINKIKKKILDKYPNLFEWLEIKKEGTGYTIRFEKRITSNDSKDLKIYDIVASKDARIISIYASSGQIAHNIGEYVKAGDVIISSRIMLNDEEKYISSSAGLVYGETWYKVSVNMPKNYQKKKISGNCVNTYSLNFFSSKIIFDKSSFNDKIIVSIPIIENRLFPISINKEIIKEVVIDPKEKYDLAISLCLDEIKNKLKDQEEIIDYFVLDKNKDNDSYNVSLFVSVKEEIGVLVAR